LDTASSIDQHGGVSAQDEAKPALAERRVRLSGTDDAPRGRGLLHLAALVVAVPAATLLVWLRGAGGGVWLYAASLVGLYAVSASYHLCAWGPASRRRMRQLDHGMIFVFIASSATPYFLLGAPGRLSDVVLGIVWAGAAAAVVAVGTSFEASHALTSTAYIVLGWSAVVTLPDAVRHLDGWQLAMLGSMGLFYTAGAGVLATRWPDPAPKVFGYHEVWHAMVVVASACGFLLIWSFAGPHH
jgi:hemolysin III